VTTGKTEAQMATTHQTNFEFEIHFPDSERPSHSARYSEGWHSTKNSVLREALRWNPSDAENSHTLLESRWKFAAERITDAAKGLRGETSSRAVPSASAKALSDNAAIVELALRESRAVLQTASDLPHVKRAPRQPGVPRSFALADAFLRFTDFQFEEACLAEVLLALQDKLPLKMSEIWNLKAFLELVLLERIGAVLAQIAIAEHNREAGVASGPDTRPMRLRVLVDTLCALVGTDWKVFFEKASLTERILRLDPQGAYQRSDYATRDSYRASVAELSDHANCTEPEAARRAVVLARLAQSRPASSDRTRERRTHVGYYLVDAGREILKKEIGYRPRFLGRVRELILRWPDLFYLPGIELIGLGITALLLVLLRAKPGIIAVALLGFAALECAVTIMNLLATRWFPPRRLPKLDFSNGIPANCTTVVAVPTLLTSEDQVRQAAEGLEVRFLANRDRNLHFALLTDLPDSTQQFDEREKLVEFCANLMRELDEKYRHQNNGRIFLFHRPRTYNAAEDLWMGWERKRGKLLDFNRFLLKQGDPFQVKTGDLSALKDVRYAITLDLDTQLPLGAGRKLVGTMAHPLNLAVIDPSTNTVVEGYGILQPRVDISIKSTSRSRFASLVSGDTGLDLYTRAVSDVYQDLFGEGIFTGKGIYEIATFQKVLEHRFPCNKVLSHDLIEGAYARTALVSDIEVVDDYPSHFSAFSRRKHRWVRGDWQILFGLLPRVPNYFGQLVPNSLSHISRWKIIDNLRRSLLEFATLSLLLYGWLFYHGDVLRWTLAAVGLMLLPAFFQLGLQVLTAGKALFGLEFWRNLAIDLAGMIARAFVRLAFLCHQSLVGLDAVVRAIVRMKFTHKRLLEWETAADAETSTLGANLVDRYLKYSLLFTAIIALLVYLVHPSALEIAAPFLILWASSIWICEWLNRPQKQAGADISDLDRGAVRGAALRTWRFFRDFSNAEENWLIPDIVQDAPPLVAHRVSPTNLGLLLNSRLAACDLGFLTLSEFVEGTENTLRTVSRMPKWRGHFYNWYTTDTLEPVPPLFISTVDNGNLVGSLWTLKQGCLEMIGRPLLQPALWDGIRDHVVIVAETIAQSAHGGELVPLVRELKGRVDALPSSNVSWCEALRAFEIDVVILLERVARSDAPKEIAASIRELSARVTTLRKFASQFVPWLDPQFQDICPLPQAEIETFASSVTLESIPRLHRKMNDDLAAASESSSSDSAARKRLRAALEQSIVETENLLARLRDVAGAAESLAEAMDFSILYDAKKHAFSIGYEQEQGALSSYNYDLLASEARTAVFIGIAKGEAPQESWLHLKRSFRSFADEDVLLSWSGTGFEYLMPCLWMKAHPETLLERSVQSAIRAQQKFAAKNSIPWGISESSCNQRNPDGHYLYHAFGVPGLAIHKDDHSGDLVVAPYVTFLSLMFDPANAIKNLRKMTELGWLSAYGFYEAGDFTPRRVNADRNHEIVRNWMAHHQGMSLLAAANALCDFSLQRRFHAEPRVAAVERLLHERFPRQVAYAEEGAAAGASSVLRILSGEGLAAALRNLVPRLS